MSREISRRSRSSWSGAAAAHPPTASSTSIRTCPPGSPRPITPSSRRSRTRWQCCCSPSLREQPKSPRRRVVVQQLGVAAPLDDGGEQRLRRNEREVDGQVGEQLLVRELGLARALLDLLGLLLQHRDRKSTRLNSSHLVISYAVFCLKKKKKTYKQHEHNQRLGHTTQPTKSLPILSYDAYSPYEQTMIYHFTLLLSLQSSVSVLSTDI